MLMDFLNTEGNRKDWLAELQKLNLNSDEAADYVARQKYPPSYFQGLDLLAFECQIQAVKITTR